MCFHSKQTKKAKELEARFNASFDDVTSYKEGVYNGFTYPKTPIITHDNKNVIQLYNWGLIPSWAKDIDFRKNTLNAKIETLHEKPSFKNSLQSRCIILLDGFYEWKWLDDKGKVKQKYEIGVPENDAFAMAGLWNSWKNPQTHEVLNTYTIITTEANELMAEIHNTKKRMPFILTKEQESLWLKGEDIKPIKEIELVAHEV